jgi:hypothetical protein
MGAAGAAASGAGTAGAMLVLESEVLEDWQPVKSTAANINGATARQIERGLFFMFFIIVLRTVWRNKKIKCCFHRNLPA